MFGNRSSEKGQAAVTDALYFLLIVSGLSVFLFVFANNFGQSVSTNLLGKYSQDFSSSALKTILYSSVSKTSDELENSLEVDYLLAVVKQDFADNGLLDDSDKLLQSNVELVMQPIEDSFDYLFFIQRACHSPEEISEGNCEEIFFAFYHSASGINAESKQNFLCSPESLARIQSFLVGLSNTSQTSLRVSFNKKNNEGNPEEVLSEIDLIAWPSIKINNSFLDSENLNCSIAEN